MRPALFAKVADNMAGDCSISSITSHSIGSNSFSLAIGNSFRGRRCIGNSPPSILALGIGGRETKSRTEM